MIPVRAAVVPVLFFLISCSTPPVLHLEEQQVRTLLAELCKDVTVPVAFKGSGSVLFVTNGEKQSGSFDERYKSVSSMAATFYSPMGTIIGSISAHGDSGVVMLPEHSFQLPLASPLDSLKLAWVSNITLGALITALCGKVAHQFNPDSLVEKPQPARHRREFTGENKTIGYAVISSNDLKKLKRIVVTVGTKVPSEKKISIVYESFFSGIARYITIKVDDRNYFSLRYDNVQMVRQE